MSISSETTIVRLVVVSFRFLNYHGLCLLLQYQLLVILDQRQSELVQISEEINRNKSSIDFFPASSVFDRVVNRQQSNKTAQCIHSKAD